MGNKLELLALDAWVERAAGMTQEEFVSRYAAPVLVIYRPSESDIGNQTLDVLETEEPIIAASEECRVAYFEANGNPNYFIGRADDDAIAVRIGHSSVSKLHASLAIRRDGAVHLIDASKNGTMVDGKKITGVTELQDFAKIMFGQVSTEFYKPEWFYRFLKRQ